jgi:hypothetical protein
MPTSNDRSVTRPGSGHQCLGDVVSAPGNRRRRLETSTGGMNLIFSLVEDPRREIARQFGGDDVILQTYVIDRSGIVGHQAIGYGNSGFADLLLPSSVQLVGGRRKPRAGGRPNRPPVPDSRG